MAHFMLPHLLWRPEGSSLWRA
ncbi:uncharacterized protein G2W53_018248 [Senna tora]|uniref:Uncharacterized protein n=1 Tax=Senna tora TaxID=362788 RepID=A0A834U078_9FABA|nr:uncharacterized protein G2W53_018248 [Senna tora]